MRVGTTSYIYPADILPNVRLLAGKVADVELLLLEMDEGMHNLPDRETVSELRQIAAAAGMTYTVHLPLDLRLAADDNVGAIAKARRVIEAMAPLEPYGYVVHLEGEAQGTVDPEREFGNAVRALEALAAGCASPDLLCVENLESQPAELIDSVLAATPVSCCVDVGHLWKRGEDPVPHLKRRLQRTRVIHLHGVGSGDHQRLSVVPDASLDAVTGALAESYRGVVTLEVFNETDFLDSIDTFRRSLHRVTGQ